MNSPLRLLARWLLRTALFAGMASCVDKFIPTLALNTNLLVVEGIITDQPTTQAITLSRSRSTPDSNTSIPITKAQVQVVVNGSAVNTLAETRPGRYELPATFRGKAGDSYQLRFTTAEGTRYESSTETMISVPAIQKVYDQYEPNGPSKTVDGLPTPTSNIYLDYQEPAGTRNFYLWRWTLYESQQWCATCQQGKYYLTDLGDRLTGACVPDPKLGIYNVYDYTCFDFCWDLFYSQNINIVADIYTNGQTQLGRLVAQIPIYQKDPALIDIEQLSLTAGAYRYYKLFQDQTQNTGTLADTPPAPTVGNVRNLGDANENVVGYFTASAVAVNHYWLDRKNVTSGSFRGLFYATNGRVPNVEPPRGDPKVYGSNLPSALCVPGNTRTDKQPIGWH